MTSDDANWLRNFERAPHTCMASGYNTFFSPLSTLATPALLDTAALRPRSCIPRRKHQLASQWLPTLSPRNSSSAPIACSRARAPTAEVGRSARNLGPALASATPAKRRAEGCFVGLFSYAGGGDERVRSVYGRGPDQHDVRGCARFD